MNDLKFIVEQTGDDGAVMSRLTLEYPGLANADANAIQIAYIRGMLETAGTLAAEKAAFLAGQAAGQD